MKKFVCEECVCVFWFLSFIQSTCINKQNTPRAWERASELQSDEAERKFGCDAHYSTIKIKENKYGSMCWIIAAAESITLYLSVTQFYGLYRAVLILTKR